MRNLVPTAATDRRAGWAWVALCLALALHVLDEALTDFLSYYNPAVRAIRQQWPFLPLPVFTFRVWLTGLVVAIVVLFSLSPLAFRGARWLVLSAYVFAVVMILNGLGHMAGSLHLGRPMPGLYSSPFLLVCAVYLLIQTYHRR